MKIPDFLFDRRSCLWFCRTNEFSSGAPILACWHICCSAQNLPPTRYNTQPSHPTVYTRHPLCIPFGSAYGVSYTYAPSSIIQLLFHKSRTIQRGANQDEYDFFLFSCFLRQVESSIFSKIYSAEACSADLWYGYRDTFVLKCCARSFMWTFSVCQREQQCCWVDQVSKQEQELTPASLSPTVSVRRAESEDVRRLESPCESCFLSTF